MHVLILATDEQRTLPPLSTTLPGPLIPVVGRPVLATTIEILARAGQKQILVSLYERGGQIAAYFGGGRRWGVDIQYLTQRQAWGSAGALRFAGGLLHTTTLVLPGAALLDLDVDEALAFHRAHGGMVTAIVHAPFPGSQAPLVRMTADGRLCESDVSDVAAHGQLTGAYLIEPAVLGYIAQHGVSDIACDLIPAIIAAGEHVYAYQFCGYWNPMDSLAAFQEAQEVYLESAYRQQAPERFDSAARATVRFPSLEARQVAPGIWVGHNHLIHPSARLAPPIYIGPNSWIGREVELGPMAVIGANVVIDDEATVCHSTVLEGTYVGRLVCAEQRILTPGTISDPETTATTQVVDPFLLGRVGDVVTSRGIWRRLTSMLAVPLLIVLLSPLLALVALCASIGSGGRPLVRTPRIGRRVAANGEVQTFQMLQFQTRRPGGTYTPFGRLLESWELEHLPSLFNVLTGDMALVGVKPLRPEEYVQLTEDWQQRRDECPAGFTGLWFLQTSASSSLDTVIITDVYYTATKTWLGDLHILLQTPAAWFQRRIRDGRQHSPLEVVGYPGYDDRLRGTHAD